MNVVLFHMFMTFMTFISGSRVYRGKLSYSIEFSKSSNTVAA